MKVVQQWSLHEQSLQTTVSIITHAVNTLEPAALWLQDWPLLPPFKLPL